MERVYRVLARVLLPRAFREEYGEEMRADCAARLASERRWSAKAALFASELVDLVRTAGRERRSARRAKRPLRGPGLSGDVGQDVRFALRRLRRAPGFAAILVGTLGLGIGLDTAAFSAVYAVLLRPLAGVARPDRLVQVYRSWPEQEFGPSSIPHFEDLRERGADLFDGVAAWSFVTVALGGDASEAVVGQMASDGFFDVLGVHASLGRTFLGGGPEGSAPRREVVLSHDFWQTRFGADRSVVGRALVVNGTPFEVVGVAPAGFRGAVDLYAPALWVPLSTQPLLQPGREDRPTNRDSNFLHVLARLRDGATLEATRAGAAALLDGLRGDYPDVYEGTALRLVRQSEAGMGPSYGGAPARFATLLMALSGLLLLLACANVANLLLSRAEERRRELALRRSVGASRGRVLRQLLTEGVVLAALAGAAGTGLAWLAVRLLDQVRTPTALPLAVGFSLEPPVLAFTLATALATTLVFGLVPAVRASRTEAGGLARAASRGGATGRLAGALVAAQTALALVLLLTGGVFLRSLVAASRIDPGFEAARLLSARLGADLLGYDRAALEGFAERLRSRMRGEPGVVEVSWADALPLVGSGQATRVEIPGWDALADEPLSVAYARVGPRYFQTMGIPLLRGRGIEDVDGDASDGVVVVNEAMARRFWPGEDPIGRPVRVQGASRRVVGVAADGRYRDLDEEPTPFIYLALAQDFRAGITLLVRTRGDPAGQAGLLRRIVREQDPAMPVREVRTLRDRLGAALFPSRVAAGGLGLLAALGVLLAVLGIYGVVAHTVARERRPMGIRVALGAPPGHVLAAVLSRTVRATLVGIGVGLALALLVVRVAHGLLYLPHAADPVAFVVAPVVLLAVALLASWVPARRAARVHPAEVLHSE